MSWRFRTSFKIIPGLKLNLSKTGLSASIGGTPLTLNLGSRGLYGTASIPGTGISYRQRISGFSKSDRQPSQLPPELPNPGSAPNTGQNQSPIFDSQTEEPQEIRSASTESMTSDSLRNLKRLIQMAHEEHEAISDEYKKAKEDEVFITARFSSWNNGFILKRIFKKTFADRKAKADLAIAKASVVSRK